MSVWEKARAGLSSVMPIASKVLGTAHPLAGLAVDVLAGALNVETEGRTRRSVERELEKRVENPTAADLVALQKANNEFEVKMAELGIDEAQLDVQLAEIAMKNRDSARNLARATGIWPQFTLAALLTAMVGGLAYFLVWMLTAEVEPKPAVLALISTLFGAVLSEWRSCMAFFTGTTHGSSRKTDAMSPKGSA